MICVSKFQGEPGNIHPDFERRLERLEELVQSLKTKKIQTDRYPRTCADVVGQNRTSGFYILSPEPNYLRPVAVYCLFNGSEGVFLRKFYFSYICFKSNCLFFQLFTIAVYMLRGSQSSLFLQYINLCFNLRQKSLWKFIYYKIYSKKTQLTCL